LHLPFINRLWRSGRARPRVGFHHCGNQPALVVVSSGLSHPVVESGFSTNLFSDGSIEEMVRRFDLRKADTVLCLDMGEYEVVNMERPPVPDDELSDAIRWKAGDLLPFPVDEAQLDFFTIPDLDSQTRAANWIFVVAARRNLVQQRVEQAAQLGLNVTAVDIPEFALRNINAGYLAEHQSLAHLLVGARSSMLCITRGEVLYFSRNILIGREGLDLAPSADAEEGAGERLILEVQRSLDYFDRHFAQPPVTRLVVSPPGPDLQALLDSLKEALAIPVAPLDSDRLPQGSASHLFDNGAIDDPCVLLALGAALRDLPLQAAGKAA